MPDRILLVQLADIGDLIVTIPAIIALREALPDAHLTLLTSHHAKAVIAADLVDAILAFDKKGLQEETKTLKRKINAKKNIRNNRSIKSN